MHVPVSSSVLLSCYIVTCDAVYHFYNCEIYWFKLFTYLTSYFYILLLPLTERVAFNSAIGNCKKKMDEINPLSKFVSPLISYISAKILLPFRGSFAVQSGDHFRSWDHLRSNLGIICGTGIICGPVQTGISTFRGCRLSAEKCDA